MEKKGKVELEDVGEWAEPKKINVLEISAKNGTNVEKCFNEIIRFILDIKSKEEILEKYGMNSQNEENKLKKDKNHNKNKKKKCC